MAVLSYGTLAQRVLEVEGSLRALTSADNHAALIVEDDPAHFIELYFGCLRAGVVPVTVAPERVVGEHFGSYLGHLAARFAPVCILGVSDADRLSTVAARHAPDAVLWDPWASEQPAVACAPASSGPLPRWALVQHTSGTTGPPRSIHVRPDRLAANIERIWRWLHWSPRDAVASWLPLHHDMGLIGLCLSPVCAQSELWAMKPMDFLRQPAEWLRSLGHGRATMTSSPPFGYAYAARRVPAAITQGLDLSGVRNAIVGAELLTAQPLLAFARAFEPSGFRIEAFRPAYGLAEATLAVTGAPVETPPVAYAVAPSNVQQGDVLDLLPVVLRPSSGHTDFSGQRVLVSSGQPLPGVAIDIVDFAGGTLPDGHVGEIVVSSPSLATREAAQERPDGIKTRLATGDLGVLVDGEVLVLGRIADAVNVRGKLVLAEQLEWQISSGVAVAASRCAVVATQRLDGPQVTAVLEDVTEDQKVGAQAILSASLGSSVAVRVVAVAKGTIPRTTSGKAQRRRLVGVLAALTADERADAASGD